MHADLTLFFRIQEASKTCQDPILRQHGVRTEPTFSDMARRDVRCHIPFFRNSFIFHRQALGFQLTNRWPRFLALNPSGSVGTYSEFRAKDLALDWPGRRFESPRPQNNNTLPRVGPPPRDVRFQQSRQRAPAERT